MNWTERPCRATWRELLESESGGVGEPTSIFLAVGNSFVTNQMHNFRCTLTFLKYLASRLYQGVWPDGFTTRCEILAVAGGCDLLSQTRHGCGIPAGQHQWRQQVDLSQVLSFCQHVA